MKNFSSKKALLLSVLSMVICVSMLIGSTFAWFTDSATANVNEIKSGNLEIALEMSKDGGNTWETVNDNSRLDFLVNGALPAGDATILWEPGCTFELPLLRVRNSGNLALKYQVVISGATGDTKLLDVIKFTAYVGDDTQGTTVNVKDGSAVAKGMLVPAEKADETNKSEQTIKISAHMDETANNNYKNLTLKDIKISVVATQATYEYDSNSNQYDAGAEMVYPEGITNDSFAENQTSVDSDGNFYTSFKDAMAGVANGGTIYLKEGSTIDFPTHLNVTKNITIQGNGADFSGKDISIGTYAAPENTETTIEIYNAKNLVVWGQPTANLSDSCTWNVKFYNCANDGYNFLMYRGGESATAKINLVIENCKANGFRDSTVHTTADGSIVIKNTAFTNNCAPVNIAHKQSGTMTVSVENCTFVNCGKIDTSNDYFAPARFVNNSTVGTLNVTLTNNGFSGTIGTNGDILLGDYRTGKASHKVTATIVTSTPVMVKSSEDAAYSYAGGTIVAGLKKAAAATQTELNNVISSATEPTSVTLSAGTYTLPTLENKDITVKGTKDTIVNMKNVVNKASSASFDGVTVNFGTEDYRGFQHTGKLTYKDCTITGKQFLYAEEVEFINCEFVQDAVDYNVWTYGAGSVLFKDCTFTCKGKAVLIYNEGALSAQTVEFRNCKFEASSAVDGKAAIEIDSRFTSYTVIIDQATADNVTGFGTGSNSGNSVWNVKTNVKPVTVTVADTVVYNQ